MRSLVQKSYTPTVAVQPTIPGEEHSVALALVNSLHASPSGPVDHIEDAASLWAWLFARGLTDADHDVIAGDVAGVQALRTAVRELLAARIEHRAPDRVTVDEVNAAAAMVPRAPALQWESAGRPERTSAPTRARSAARVLAAIATDAIDLLCDERGDSLAACGGPRCVRILLKNHPRRQWCTPACGERIRAARYYKRHKKRTEPTR